MMHCNCGGSALLFLSSLLISGLHSNCSAFTIQHSSSSADNGSRAQTLLLLEATAIEPQMTTTLDSISVTLPRDWKETDPASGSWSKEAAAILNEHGAVALTSDDNDDGLITNEICDSANQSAFTRVEEMHNRIESRGLDPKGVEEPYRFAEIICRDDGGRRYDVPVPWLGDEKHTNNKGVPMMGAAVGSKRIGAPLQPTEEDAISELHSSIGKIVASVMDALWSKNSIDNPTSNQSYVAAAGFLMNQPGSNSQKWHRDGPDEGYIDCFVPLIDLNESVGPTAIQLGTHTAASSLGDDENGSEKVLIPLLKKGNILLFDYRTIHRGLGNKSDSTTRTLAYTVYRRKEEESSNDSGDVHNFPAALTLEYD
mmetsp:Transcript_1793/g.3850  ORF Transcript_1793/g.3850 Transcript_1793/m.3850 type:complete len:369 (-) Transcript_1793:499-1605(-)